MGRSVQRGLSYGGPSGTIVLFLYLLLCQLCASDWKYHFSEMTVLCGGWCCRKSCVKSKKAWLLERYQWEEVGTSAGCGDARVTGGVWETLPFLCQVTLRFVRVVLLHHTFPPRIFTSSQAQRNVASWHRPKTLKWWLKTNSLQVDYFGCFVVARETSRHR